MDLSQTLHNKVRGTRQPKEYRDIPQEVECLAEIDPSQLPQEIKFLLELDFDSLYRSPRERQSYWVYAIQASWWTDKHQPLLNIVRD